MATRLGGLGTTITDWFRQQPVLPIYRRQRPPIEIWFKRALSISICVFLGLFYGLAFVILPPQLFIYMGGPILVLALLIIWALPDTGRSPVNLLSKLFATYVVILVLWPNYLALQLPGLPWISFRRLVMFPMSLILLICLSISSRFRSELREVLHGAKPLAQMMIAFTAIQIITLPFSNSIFFSLNVTVNYLFGTTTAFFVGAWFFRDPKRGDWAVSVLLFMAFFLCVMSVFEFRNQGVLWAKHIPSFLQVQDEAVMRGLTAAIRDGAYRVVGPFSTALSLAEYLALITPFVLHRAMNTKRLEVMALWIGFDLLLLLAVNLTQSRLGVLGWLIAHGYYICIWAFTRWRRFKAEIVAPAVALLYPIGVAFFTFGMFFIPAIRNRTIGGGSSGLSDDSRKEQFAMMWPKLFKNPLGYGSGQSGDVLGYRLPGGLLTVDSYIITMLLEYGVIGFLLYFGMLAYSAGKLTTISYRDTNGSHDIALPLATTFVIAIQVKAVLSQQDNIPLIALLTGLAAAVIWNAQKTGLAKPKSNIVTAS